MSKVCQRCGTSVIDEANYCMKCGYDFRVTEESEQSPEAKAEPKEEQPVNRRAAPWVQNSGVVNPKPVAGYETCNPTFHLRCEYCYFEFDYHAYDLGHRVWYPHGFVYCPRCHRPLRHRLEYEVIDSQNEQEQPASESEQK